MSHFQDVVRVGSFLLKNVSKLLLQVYQVPVLKLIIVLSLEHHYIFQPLLHRGFLTALKICPLQVTWWLSFWHLMVEISCLCSCTIAIHMGGKLLL